MRIRDSAVALLAAAFLALSAPAGAGASPAVGTSGPTAGTDTIVVAQGGSGTGSARGSEPPELQPRYQPVEPEHRSWYNTDYFFAFSRTIAGSTMVPAAKLPLYVLALPCDLALLPFAAIGGLFG